MSRSCNNRMTTPERLRFGVFQFVPGTRELWRDGHRVRLQAQPAQVLSLLLARAGEIVTRDELRLAVWGNGTFVDFDRGLNFCIAQIRSALGDSADSPLFVRTIPKRGYQFIAPVSGMEAAPVPPARKASWLRPAFATALLATIALLVVQRVWPARPSVRIAVTRFDNETGNPALDRFADGLTDAVVADLTSSGGYGIIGNAAILRVPRPKRDLRAIASSLGVRYVILGQVQGDPLHPRILAHLIRVPEQTHVWVTRRDNVSLSDPSQVQSETATQIAHEFTSKLTSQKPLAN